MRKITLLATLLTLSTLVNAQALKKGDFFINPGLGFGIERTQTNIKNDTIEGALPGLLNLTAGYMISEKFGLQVRFERNGYISDPKDSIQAVTGNFLIGANYNFINNPVYAMHVGILLGGSSLTFTPSDKQSVKNDVEITAGGSAFQLNVGGNAYFSQHLGLFYEIGYASRKYSKITIYDKSANPQEQEWIDDKGTNSTSDDQSIEVDISGIDIRIGLAIRF